jgi:hypothetical protein
MNGRQPHAQEDAPRERKQSAEPKPMVEQPKRRIALAASEMRRKPDEKKERADKKRRQEPDLPGKLEQDRDDDDAAKPKRDAGGLRAPVRLDVKIGGNNPKKRRRKRAQHAKLGIAGNVVAELVEGQGRGECNGKGKPYGSAADIGNATLPPGAPPLAHRSLPLFIAASLPSARTGRAD